MSAVIDAVNVTKTYGDGDARVHALRGLSLKIGPGDESRIASAARSWIGSVATKRRSDTVKSIARLTTS